MRALQVVGAVAALSLLGACGVTSGYELANLREAQPTGDDFTKALTAEYTELASFEADEMYDFKDSSYYSQKGLRAASGETVLPQAIAERDLPADHVAELTQARADLVGLLFAGARDQVPARAAKAQAKFDCWMEQQEENFQPDHIAACREEFLAALKDVQVAMAPAPAPAMAKAEPAPMAPVRYVVYFPFDSADLSEEAMKTIDEAAAMAAKDKLDLSVTGHADRAGAEDYNMDLSLKRAGAVQALLGTKDIMGDKISVGGRGEAEPAVATADGVQEQANRRVEIILTK